MDVEGVYNQKVIVDLAGPSGASDRLEADCVSIKGKGGELHVAASIEDHPLGVSYYYQVVSFQLLGDGLSSNRFYKPFATYFVQN